MANFAIPLKPYLGKGAYVLYLLKLMVFGKPLLMLDAEIDGEKWPNQQG